MQEPLLVTSAAPVVRNPAVGGGYPPAGAMQTAVQLTFSFEIASIQLTPNFKMGALQLRPASNIVTMRLAPSELLPAMNLQVTFEIARIQPAGGGLGIVRLVPSQQQRPDVVGAAYFTVAGLRLLSNFEAAPVQLTPSQQSSVLVTGAFQIATVEFSPSFEIAVIVLNSSAKQLAVQLPGARSVEGAPRFQIANLQLRSSGEIGLMQLNLLGQGPGHLSQPERTAVVHYAEPKSARSGELIRTSARESKNQDLTPFREALRNHQDLLSNNARVISVEFELPRIQSFNDFADRGVAETLETQQVEITPWLSRDANIDCITFLASYPSGHVRPVNVDAARQGEKVFARFPDSILFLDPAAPLEEWELSGLKGRFDLLPLELPAPNEVS